MQVVNRIQNTIESSKSKHETARGFLLARIDFPVVLVICLTSVNLVPAFQHVLQPDHLRELVILLASFMFSILAYLSRGTGFGWTLGGQDRQLSCRVFKVVSKRNIYTVLLEAAFVLSVVSLTVLSCRQLIGDALFSFGDYKSASQFYKTFPLTNPKPYRVMADHGPRFCGLFSPKQELERAVEWSLIAQNVYGDQSLEAAIAIDAIGSIHHKMQQLVPAQLAYREAAILFNRNNTVEGYGDVMLKLALIYEVTQPQLAEDAYRESLAIRLNHLQKNHWRVLESRYYLMNFLSRIKQSPEEVAQLKLAQEAAEPAAHELAYTFQILIFYVFLIEFFLLRYCPNGGLFKINPDSPKLAKVSSHLRKKLSGTHGIDSKILDDLCTLLIYQGRHDEADELTSKVIKLAETSPELIIGQNSFGAPSLPSIIKGV